MKFTVEAKAFARPADMARGVAPARSIIPIASCALIEASDRLRVSACDLDMESAIEIKADISARGIIAVRADALAAFVGSVELGASIEGVVEEGRLRLRSGRSRATISGLPGEDFPHIGLRDAPHEIALDGAELRRLLRGTLFAASKEASRYYLIGTCLEFGDGIIAVATDGHILSKRWTPGTAAPSIIVPTEAAALIAEYADGACRLRFSERALRLECGDTTLTTKLIDGTFPDWRRVVPEVVESPFVVGRKTLLAAVESASAVAATGGTAVRSVAATGGTAVRSVTLSFGAGGITLTGKSAFSDYQTEIDCDGGRDGLSVVFNPKHLAAILSSFDTERVELHGVSVGSPWLICGADNREDFGVIMPMRF